LNKILAAVATALLLGTSTQPVLAQENPNPILVVDKCPEFCPPPPPRFCAQVIIPVPWKKGWYWTDACRTKMVQGPGKSNPPKPVKVVKKK
jgi:hypothetical protein